MDTLKKAMISALRKHLGRVTRAAAECDIARSTHYDWLKNDEEYKAAVDDINEEAIDHVESKLFESIDGLQVQRGVDEEGNPVVYDVPPNVTAAIFYLKTIGKRRGYIERNEITGADGGPVQIIAPDNI